MKRKVLMAAVMALGASCGFAGRRVSLECDTLDAGEYRAYAKLAKELGATHLAASQVEPSMWQWNRDRNDPYPNWSMHRPTVFKFIVPKALEKYIPADYAARNLARLRERVAILEEFGLKASFTGQEPAYLPEEAYRDHPNWRGPRCDQCVRARTEYYAPCVDDPEMRAIYVDAVAELCRAGHFESFELMCNDSGAGLCWYPQLYPGANGPNRCRGVKSVPRRIVDFLSIFQEGAAKVGCNDMRVNLNRYVSGDILESVLPMLKEGMRVCNRTLTRKTAVCAVGFQNPFAEHTYPVFAMPRMPTFVEQLQKIEVDPEADVILAVRSLDETDLLRLLRTYWGRRSVGQGKLARYAALNSIAATFVGETRSEELVRVWDAVETCYALWDWAQTGGHIFLLGTTHQRWLTRPLVCFPEELTVDEKSFYRPYVFQAREEKCAEDLVDLQGNRWLEGYGGAFAVRGTFNRSYPHLDSAVAAMRTLIPHAADAESARYLKGLLLKLRLYKIVMENARHTVEFQQIVAEGKTRNDTKIRFQETRLQDDPPFERVSQVIRDEIDNTHDLIALLRESEKEGLRIIRTADSPAFENVMNLPPVKILVEQLGRKVAVMEDHRRDVTRIFRQPNR